MTNELKQQVISEFAGEAGVSVNALTNARLKLPFISSCMGFYIANGELSGKQKTGIKNTLNSGRKKR